MMNFTELIPRGITKLGEIFREASATELIILRRHVHGKGLMGTLGVVDTAPALKQTLAVSKWSPPASSNHLSAQGAMKAFVLAQHLGVIGTAMNHSDA